MTVTLVSVSSISLIKSHLQNHPSFDLITLGIYHNSFYQAGVSLVLVYQQANTVSPRSVLASSSKQVASLVVVAAELY